MWSAAVLPPLLRRQPAHPIQLTLTIDPISARITVDPIPARHPEGRSQFSLSSIPSHPRHPEGRRLARRT